MSIHTYMLFIGASVVLCLVPGPDMLFLLGQTVAKGRAAGLSAALGINLGAYVHLLAAITGLSALILASATAFAVVKFAGAAYLIYLGWTAIRAKGGFALPEDVGLQKTVLRRIFWQGFLSDVLNPKVALFYIALLPQFVSAQDSDAMTQLVVLGVTGNMVGIATSVIYVFVASKMTAILRRSPTISAWMTKLMGAMFVSLGAKLATEKL
ncbi:LysE family translocator [Cupriavidus sp. SW-Y-13]|uniref:LysE family translocator n=1 Tax=Cupriavidus sp. SW-Y-13 TaxID=2653854 RepID=UPI001366791C|nr:LysE family translocator [Cupriavidus sp. SW-Y-13]